MSEAQLIEILRNMHRNAPQGEKGTSILLFGIRYVAELAAPHVNVTEVARQSVGHSYQAEIHKGMNLAKYVDLNYRAAAHGL